jgi:hypothetical protein
MQLNNKVSSLQNPARSKGQFTHTMPFPCRSSAVPLPFHCHSPTVPLSCRFAKSLDFVFPIWFTQYGHVLIHTYHTVPLPCRSAKGLDFVFPIWFTQCGRFYSDIPCCSPAMPWICRSESDLSRPRQGRGRGTAWERHGTCELAFNTAGECHGMCESVLTGLSQSHFVSLKVKIHPLTYCESSYSFFHLGARLLVSATPRPLWPRGRTSSYSTAGWVGTRICLVGRDKWRTQRGSNPKSSSL